MGSRLRLCHGDEAPLCFPSPFAWYHISTSLCICFERIPRFSPYRRASPEVYLWSPGWNSLRKSVRFEIQIQGDLAQTIQNTRLTSVYRAICLKQLKMRISNCWLFLFLWYPDWFSFLFFACRYRDEPYVEKCRHWPAFAGFVYFHCKSAITRSIRLHPHKRTGALAN